MIQNRCADYYQIPLRLLFAVAVVCCCLTTCIESRAQFSNMRVFRTNGMFNKDHWRPMDIFKSFKINKEQETDSSRAAEIVSASSIKRVSMASLLQQLNQVNSGKKDVFFPTPIADKPGEVSSLSIPVTIIESNRSAITPVVKESTIRRVKLPAGSISYSRNGPASNGPSILLNINPHLQRSTRFPNTEPPTTTEPSTTTTTTEPSTTTTTTEPSTTTTTEPTTTEPSTSAATEPCVTKVYVKAKPHEQQAVKHYANKAKTPASVRAEDNILASSKKLSQMPNSPIYYIKLPASSFVSGRTPHKEDAVPLDFFKQSPIFVATTRRPANGSNNVVEQIASTTTESSSETLLSTTTKVPPRTNSRVINIKGPFVFNGKPGGIYSAPAPYRPPNYLDLLHQIYPKLKRAQFIRR